MRHLEHTASRVTDLGDRVILLALCARSGFTEQVLAEAAQRRDLWLFDLPQIIEG